MEKVFDLVFVRIDLFPVTVLYYFERLILVTHGRILLIYVSSCNLKKRIYPLALKFCTGLLVLFKDLLLFQLVYLHVQCSLIMTVKLFAAVGKDLRVGKDP